MGISGKARRRLEQLEEDVVHHHEFVQAAIDGHPKQKPLILNERGAGAYEAPDPIPMAPPVGYQRQPSIQERIRDMVRSEHLRMAAEGAGAESFEEGDDFDVDDDYDPQSPYENEFEGLPIAELRKRQAEAEKPPVKPAPTQEAAGDSPPPPPPVPAPSGAAS